MIEAYTRPKQIDGEGPEGFFEKQFYACMELCNRTNYEIGNKNSLTKFCDHRHKKVCAYLTLVTPCST